MQRRRGIRVFRPVPVPQLNPDSDGSLDTQHENHLKDKHRLTVDFIATPPSAGTRSEDCQSQSFPSSISKLPLELLLEVLSYVDLEDFFNLRRSSKWLHEMLRSVTPPPSTLSPWLSVPGPRSKILERAQLVQSITNLQFRKVDLPVKTDMRDFRMSGSVASWRLDDQTYLLRDFETGKQRVLKFDEKTSAREFSSTRAVVATADRMIHMFDDPFASTSEPTSYQMDFRIDELGITNATTILRDHAGFLWYSASGAKPARLEDVDHRWDLVLLDMEGKHLYLLKNEGRRGISFESIDFATMVTTKHPSQTVGTIQGDEEAHGWINRHSKLWQPDQPVYYIHSTCLQGERLQIIRFNPKAKRGHKFVTEVVYDTRIRSFCIWSHFMLYDHLGRGAKSRGLMQYDFRTKKKTKFLGSEARGVKLRMSEGGSFLYWQKSQRRMTVLCFNRDLRVE